MLAFYSTVFWLCVLLSVLGTCFVLFFFKQKTAYEMRISDWSSDVCSSDLCPGSCRPDGPHDPGHRAEAQAHGPVAGGYQQERRLGRRRLPRRQGLERQSA